MDALCQALSVDPAQAARLRLRLPPDAPGAWRGLAAAMACLGELRGVLGVAGGQGAGKSTLSALLAEALGQQGRRTLVLSLDDFYLTRAERAELARREHPLLATRGVPGTHDVARLAEVLAAARSDAPLLLPVFDKGRDDRAAEPRRVRGPFALVVLEGWCVGVPPQPDSALAAPVNALEAELDADGRWRRYVNGCLAGAYAELWQRLDMLLYLAVPDLTAVVRWRSQQENERPPEARLAPAEVERFIAYYERLTRWMQETLPERADIVAYLDAEHRLARLTRRP